MILAAPTVAPSRRDFSWLRPFDPVSAILADLSLFSLNPKHDLRREGTLTQLIVELFGEFGVRFGKCSFGFGNILLDFVLVIAFRKEIPRQF